MFDPMAIQSCRLCPEKVRTLYSMMRYMLALWTWHHPSVNGLSFKGSNRNRRVFFGGFQKPGWRCAFRCRSGSGICEAPPKSGLFHLTSWDNLLGYPMDLVDFSRCIFVTGFPTLLPGGEAACACILKRRHGQRFVLGTCWNNALGFGVFVGHRRG